MTEEDTIKGVFYGAPSSVYSKYSPMSEFEQCKEYMVAVNLFLWAKSPWFTSDFNNS